MENKVVGICFMSKANRDEVWRSIPKGIRGMLRRSSIRGQLLHPMYVDDYTKETGVTLKDEDMGFGNTVYRTHFSVLYEIGTRYDLSSADYVRLQEWEAQKRGVN